MRIRGNSPKWVPVGTSGHCITAKTGRRGLALATPVLKLCPPPISSPNQLLPFYSLPRLPLGPLPSKCLFALTQTR